MSPGGNESTSPLKRWKKNMWGLVAEKCYSEEEMGEKICRKDWNFMESTDSGKGDAVRESETFLRHITK